MRVAQLRKQRVENELDIFNKYIMFKICQHLEREDQENLGRAFPQFTPNPLTPQQQQMLMMKKMQELKLKNPDLADDSTAASAASDLDTDASLDTQEGTQDAPVKVEVPPPDAAKVEEKSEDKTEPKADAAESTEEKKDDPQAQPKAPNEMTPEQKKELMKKREEQIRMNMTDCHTLLAQLNSKRLFRRIKYFKSLDPNYNVDEAYPWNCGTEDMAQLEWYALLNDYKKRVKQKIKEQKLEEAKKAEKKANRPKRRRNKKKKKGKGKGRGKKSNNKNKKEEESKIEEEPKTEEEVKAEEDPENEMSQDDESDVDEENESDKEEEDDDDDDDEDSEYELDYEDALDDPHYKYIGAKPSWTELLLFTKCPRAVAVLASYPRSGNSLMRNLYEKITLRVTGSDMMGGLQKHDLVGEMATGTENVQFVKTHYPERMGHPPFAVDRAVLLVRNPYDALDSYFNLMSTSTHTTSLSPEARKKYAKVFAEMAKKEILVWRDFHEYWLKQKIPLLVVRYEDLIRNTVAVMKKVIKFTLSVNSMTFFEDRIHRAIGEQQIENLGPYKARSGGIGKSLTKGIYTPQLLSQINYEIVHTMEKFGYKEMLVPNPKKWKLKELDQWGVFIAGTNNDQPIIINQKGLVRGPNRQTNWRQVKMMVEKDKRDAENGTEQDDTPKSVNLN